MIWRGGARRAVIDIGSNSVRLVVYAGTERVPTPVFNEKVMAGLGGDLARTGELSAKSRERCLGALRRYSLLLNAMAIEDVQVVATAAVREARNGQDLVDEIESIGFRVRVISADDEATLAGKGVVSSIPDADGIAGDLGGGSLELTRIHHGKVEAGISVPLGVLRITASPNDREQATAAIRQGLDRSGLTSFAVGRPFYMVGGTWRTLARIDMAANDSALAALHQYSIAPSRLPELQRLAAAPPPAAAKLSEARLAAAPVGAMLLAALVDELNPSELIVSSFGIREGLLYERLSEEVRSIDPLIAAARHEVCGATGQAFGDELMNWLQPLFGSEPRNLARLRHAACLIACAVSQTSHSFRETRAIDLALYGDWVAIRPLQRILVAQAVSTSFGQYQLKPNSFRDLCEADELALAHRWGLAMRLGHQLSGGNAILLKQSHVELRDGKVQLSVAPGLEPLLTKRTKRRLSQLSDSFPPQMKF